MEHIDAKAIINATLRDFIDENESSTERNNTPEAEIVKLLYIDLCNLIESAEKRDSYVQSGIIRAELEILRDTWSEFRSRYYGLSAISNQVSNQINMQALQKIYTNAIGKLIDLMNKDNNASGLPTLKIPDFSGKTHEWRSFIELFNKIVHEKNISVSYKMQYLKSSLKGEAAGMVAHLTTADQYENCLKILYRRFENKRLLLCEYLDNILDYPRHRVESSTELRKLHDVATQSMLAIQNLGFVTENWDPLIIHLLSEKLHGETIKNYECQLKDTRETPTLNEFLTYIENRYLAIQSVEAKKESAEKLD